MKGQTIFAAFFASWLNTLNIPADEEFDFYQLDPYLPQLAGDAWEAMRTGNDKFTTKVRKQYEEEVEHGMSNLFELGGNIVDQVLSTKMVGYILSAVIEDEWIQTEVDSYFGAQRRAVEGAFDKFLRDVYRKGLFEIIDQSRSTGMTGQYGSTKLRTWTSAGRIMFTFARPKKQGIEVSVSFLAQDRDALALEAGLQSVEANLSTAMAMIADVIARWPKDAEQQKLVHKASDAAPLAVLAMRAQQAR